ncbi:MAG: YdeI/OmpD-associated family protein [Bdellovibrionales bacterium]|nr:YdeI/OmpD-associated family protein [Bdellovibrionales bacterium]
MSKDVDRFVRQSKRWQKEIAKLRAVIRNTKLEESLKWNQPCYSYQGSNVAIIQPFKSYLGMMFFKGTLLRDAKGVLVNNGPNSQAGRRFEFRSMQEIVRLAPTIKAYLQEAIAIEKSGQKVKFKKTPQAVPTELKKMFSAKPNLNKAFRSLTPGRQRAYVLHFSSAKQSTTRQARIKKCIPRIMKGKGLSDP